MSKQGNSIDSLSISCPFLRKKDAKDIVIIIRLIFQYFFSISALNIVLCIQCGGTFFGKKRSKEVNIDGSACSAVCHCTATTHPPKVC